MFESQLHAPPARGPAFKNRSTTHLPRWFLQQLQRTDPGTAAKIDEGPVVLLGAAEDVARLDIAVGVPEVVNAP